MVIIPRRMISNCAHARQKSNRFTKLRSDMSFACNSQCQICKIWILSSLYFQFYSENFDFSIILLIFPKFRQKTVKSHHFLNEKVMIFWQKFLNLLEFRNWKNCWGLKIFLRLKLTTKPISKKLTQKYDKKWWCQQNIN